MTNKQIESIRKYVEGKMTKNPDVSHNMRHLDNVRKNAFKIVRLLDLEKEVDKNLLEAVCLMHDLSYSENKTGIGMVLLESRVVRKYLNEAFAVLDISASEKKIIWNAVVRHPLSFPIRKLNLDQDLYTRVLQDADTIDSFNEVRKEAVLRDRSQGVGLDKMTNAIFYYGKRNMFRYLNFPELFVVFNQEINQTGKYFYREYGSENRDTILCISGYSDSADSFKLFGDLMKGKYRVLVFDMPMIHQREQSFSMKELVEYVDGFVQMKRLNNFTIAGLSFGGLVAIEYCASHANRVKEIFLLSSLPKLIPNDLTLKLYQFARPVLMSKTFSQIYLAFNTNNVIRKLVGSEDLRPEGTVLQKIFHKSIFSTYFGSIGIDLIDKFNDFKIPKTIVLFKDDKILKIKRYESLLKSLNCKVVMFDKGGHFKTDDYWKNTAKLFINR